MILGKSAVTLSMIIFDDLVIYELTFTANDVIVLYFPLSFEHFLRASLLNSMEL